MWFSFSFPPNIFSNCLLGTTPQLRNRNLKEVGKFCSLFGWGLGILLLFWQQYAQLPSTKCHQQIKSSFSNPNENYRIGPFDLRGSLIAQPMCNAFFGRCRIGFSLKETYCQRHSALHACHTQPVEWNRSAVWFLWEAIPIKWVALGKFARYFRKTTKFTLVSEISVKVLFAQQISSAKLLVWMA